MWIPTNFSRLPKHSHPLLTFSSQCRRKRCSFFNGFFLDFKKPTILTNLHTDAGFRNISDFTWCIFSALHSFPFCLGLACVGCELRWWHYNSAMLKNIHLTLVSKELWPSQTECGIRASNPEWQKEEVWFKERRDKHTLTISFLTSSFRSLIFQYFLPSYYYFKKNFPSQNF